MITKLDLSMLSSLGLVIALSGWVSNTVSQAPTGKQAMIEASSLGLKAKGHQQKVVNSRPDFSSMKDVKQKKKAFFEYMMPMIVEQNKQLLSLRTRILSLKKQKNLQDEDKEWLKSQAEDYKVEVTKRFDNEFFKQLLILVDIIPVSLVLAQSANESAWGTSRYAVDGSNFFGQWCFTKGCGLVPHRRPAGATYEVRKFSSVSDSVGSYMHNLNTHKSYDGLRMLRASKRNEHEVITGAFLAQGLTKYSTRGQEYVKELIAMINGNKLSKYDVKEKNAAMLSYQVK